MLTSLLAAALLAASSQSASPPPPVLPQESRALLRCAAAFAIISHGQDNGNEAALKYPVLGERGREFFVRSLARLMDETGLDRAGISALISSEAQKMVDADEIESVMPSCLIFLEASGV